MRQIILTLAACAVLSPAMAHAQNFTTQAEVQPILSMTRANWVAIGTQTGNDLLYFTQILSWRCGISEIRFGLNGAAPDTVYQMEPCHRDLNPPNQIRDLPYLVFAPDSVQSVSVTIVYPDGQTDSAEFARAAIRID